MSISPETIEEYFERYEWSYNRTSDNTWVTGVRTQVASFRIFIRITDNWIYFVINPYVVSPSDIGGRLRVYFTILRYNLDMNMAKFGLDSDGDLFLAVELPTENFMFSHFADALNGLSHYAEKLYSEIFNLTHNPDLLDSRFDEELDNALELEDGLKSDADEDGDESEEDNLPALPAPRPMDDFDLPEQEDADERTIIAGKEVKIGNDGISFETAHDLDEDESLPISPAEDLTASTDSVDPKPPVESSTSSSASNSTEIVEDSAEGTGPVQQDSEDLTDNPDSDSNNPIEPNLSDE